MSFLLSFLVPEVEFYQRFGPKGQKIPQTLHNKKALICWLSFDRQTDDD